MQQTRRVLVGSVLVLVGPVPSHASETQNYAYDLLGRLVAVSSAGSINNGQRRSYCYVRAGNRTVYKSDSAGRNSAGITANGILIVSINDLCLKIGSLSRSSSGAACLHLEGGDEV